MVWLFALMSALNAISYSYAEVRLPPNIIEPRTATVRYFTSKSDFVIPCKAESKPDSPTYKWLKGTTPIVPNQYVKFDATTGDLSFTGFSFREEGDYMCVATTVFGAQGGNRITAASFSPTVTIYQIRVEAFTDTTPVLKSADEYSYMKLECANQGKLVGSDLAIKWNRGVESKLVPYDNGRLFMDQKGTLHFTFVKKSDETIDFPYLCGITSTDEKILRFGRLNILQVREVASPAPVKPLLRYSNNGVVANLYSAATLECVFSGYWLHFQNKSATVGDEPRFLIIDPVTHATIINTSLLSETEYETVGGIYRSVISHTYDSINVDVLVKLKDKPEPEDCYVNGCDGTDGYVRLHISVVTMVIRAMVQLI